MRNLSFFSILIMLLIVAVPSPATSLFDEDGCNLITIDSASEIGDLVTIIITETTSASNRAATETGKSLNTDGELTVQGFLQWITNLPPTISPVEDLTFTPSETFSGEGRVTTQGSFTTQITGVIVDVLPNGNFIIEGVRSISIADDTAELTIRGVINPDDLTIDSEIDSNQISELEILYEGEGIIAERQRDGILSRIFNFFF